MLFDHERQQAELLCTEAGLDPKHQLSIIVAAGIAALATMEGSTRKTLIDAAHESRIDKTNSGGP
jgi:hypothetical protein